jgi:arylformamidase
MTDRSVGCAVVFWTGWDDRWPHQSYLDPNPFVCAELAEYLIGREVALVGIDTWNIDDTQDMTRPVHSALLREGIPIVENLCGLGNLNARGFQFSAAPLPIRQGTAVPVRAFAVVSG